MYINIYYSSMVSQFGPIVYVTDRPWLLGPTMYYPRYRQSDSLFFFSDFPEQK